ncbi:MAG: DNA polymerase III subunit delta [Myxococcota bacterium]
MATIKNDNWQRWLQLQQREKLPSIIALGGSERAFVDEALQWIRQHVLNDATQAFNWDRYQGPNCSMQQVIATARTQPVLANRRLIEIHDAHALTATAGQSMQQIINAPAPFACLVLLFGNTPTKHSLWNTIHKMGHAFVFHSPKPYEMPRLIQHRAQRMGLHMTPAACDMLFHCIGCNVLLADRALETLQLSHDADVVTPQDVSQHIAQIPLDDLFSLSEAVAARQAAQALACLGRLQQSPDLPLRLVAVWAWQLRQVLQAKLLLQQGKQTQEICSALHLPQQRLHKLLQLARMGSLRLHCKRLCQLRALDETIKTSAAPAWLHLQAAVLTLCNR